MSSQAKIEANRANAAKSTGPKTPEGKAASRMNAVQHGLLARAALMKREDAEELATFRERMMASMKPIGELEQLLAEQVVTAAWRLRRLMRIEVEVFELDPINGMGDMFKGLNLAPEPPLALSTVFTYRGKTLEKLSRYETAIERGMYKALHELQRLQAARAGQTLPPPVAVDVNISGGFVSQNRPAATRADADMGIEAERLMEAVTAPDGD